jgi:glycosyltransferase involved in cell wall biosynthesis
MKILHLASHWGLIRGGAVQLSRMAREQHRRGHHVTVVFPDRLLKNPWLQKRDIESWVPLAESGVTVTRMRYRSFNGIKRLNRFLAREQFDIVHAHRNEAMIAVTKALDVSQLNTPVVIQRGTVSVPRKPHLLDALCSPHVKAHVVVADAVKEVHISALGTNRANLIHTVYGSVEVDHFAPRPPDEKIRSHMGIPEGARIIGSLSSYRKAKRLDLLVDVLAKIMTDHPDVYGLFLGDNLHREIIPLTQKRGIFHRCCFAGFQRDIRPWLSVMDLTVVAADAQEGLSGVLRESLAMEVPAISTRCAGNEEIINHKETGLLVPINDKTALEEAVVWALSHPREMKAMAVNGRQWVLTHCSVKTQVDHLDQIYSHIA